MNAWDNHPNGKYIDQILLSIHENKLIWEQVYKELTEYQGYQSAYKTRNWISDWHKSSTEIKKMYWVLEEFYFDSAAFIGPFRQACLALLTYDFSGELLLSPIGEVDLLMRFGVPSAILMYAACLAFHKIKENHDI